MKLQSLQNAAIRAILKLPKYIGTELLHNACGLTKLHNHTIEFAKMRISSMYNNSPLIEEVIDQFHLVSSNSAHTSPLDLISA